MTEVIDRGLGAATIPVEEFVATQPGNVPPIQTIMPNLGKWSIGAVIGGGSEALNDLARNQVELAASSRSSIGGHNS